MAAARLPTSREEAKGDGLCAAVQEGYCIHLWLLSKCRRRWQVAMYQNSHNDTPCCGPAGRHRGKNSLQRFMTSPLSLCGASSSALLRPLGAGHDSCAPECNPSREPWMDRSTNTGCIVSCPLSWRTDSTNTHHDHGKLPASLSPIKTNTPSPKQPLSSRTQQSAVSGDCRDEASDRTISEDLCLSKSGRYSATNTKPPQLQPRRCRNISSSCIRRLISSRTPQHSMS